MEDEATADLPVAQPLDEEEAARQDAQVEHKLPEDTKRSGVTSLC